MLPLDLSALQLDWSALPLDSSALSLVRLSAQPALQLYWSALPLDASSASSAGATVVAWAPLGVGVTAVNPPPSAARPAADNLPGSAPPDFNGNRGGQVVEDVRRASGTASPRNSVESVRRTATVRACGLP